MLLSWLKNRRRRKWLAQHEPSEWQRWLRDNVWQYQYLDGRRCQRVHDFVRILFHEKDWVGGGGLEVTDEMRVTIAGQAALMTLGFGRPYYFDRLRTIIIYSGHFRPQVESTENLILGRYSDPVMGSSIMSGEAWQGGPIILAWDAVYAQGHNRGARRNVVVHEFAHHMDGLDGNTDGAPPLTDFAFEKKWYKITRAEYDRLLEFARRGETTLLDHYGATNLAEFFAVSTECFFTCPHELSQEHAELFTVLERLFGQDPREWLPRVHD